MGRRAKFHISLPAIVKQRTNMWISSCPCVDVFSQGDTKEEAMANLKEALSLFVETCHEMGTLEQVMKDSGFSVITGIIKKKNETDPNMVTIPVPSDVKGVRSAECRA